MLSSIVLGNLLGSYRRFDEGISLGRYNLVGIILYGAQKDPWQSRRRSMGEEKKSGYRLRDQRTKA
jgi:hypothetical protein